MFVFCIILAFLLSVSIIPLIIKLCNNYHIYDSQNNRKIHTGNIPRLGGVGIYISFVIAAILYFVIYKDEFFYNIIPLLIAGFIIFVFAVLDDIFSLKAVLKLIFQIVATLIVVLSGFRFKQFLSFQIPEVLSYIITFGWILGIINAYNLIDGLDGLCGGLSLFAIGAIGIIFFYGNECASIVCFMLCASIAGFLCYNKPKAKIFMGDGGSQFMGFMIATLPLYYSTENFEYNKFLISIVLVSIPLLDTISAIWRRTREHRSFLSPDARHIHHKLIALGCTKVQTLIFLLLIQIILCLASGLGMYIRKDKGAIFLLFIFVFMIIFYSSIHFIYDTITQNKNITIKDLQDESFSKNKEND